MRILVLGGTRFIGPPVVRALVTDGHEVSLFHRGQTKAELPDQVLHLLGDRGEFARHVETLRRVEPEVVLDMRPIWEGDAEAVMAAFTGVARRVVAISSCDVYRAYGLLIGLEQGELTPVPLTEESPLREVLRPYRAQASGPEDFRFNYDKIPAERVFLGDARLPGTVLRLPMVYGPGDYQHRLHPWLKRMDDGRATILLGDGMAGWRSARSLVGDVASAILLAVTNPAAAGRVYNVAEPDALSELEWVNHIAAAVGWSGKPVVLPEAALPKHLKEDLRVTQHLSVASERIRTELGFRESTPRIERLRQTIAWERINPPVSPGAAAFDYPSEDAAVAAYRS